MKILIVGGAGYIGGYLTDILKDSDYEVVVYDSLLYESKYLKKVPFIFGDVRDRDKLSSLLPSFDVVIWLAAIVGDGACALNPALSQEVNAAAVEWLSTNYTGKIIFMSTCSVYGINNDLIDETAGTHPLSVYAATKLEAEGYIQQNSKKYLIFRLGTLFGASDEHARIRLDLVVNVLTKRAVLGEEMMVFGGEQWRPLLHVKDAARAILFGLEHNATGLYNLHDKNYRIREIADEIKILVPNSSVRLQEMKFEDERNYRVVSDRFRSHGWSPAFSLRDGVDEMRRVLSEGRIKNVDDPVYSNQQYLRGR
jgi:nucleoside-diphosphate-sugar epimerase